MGAAGRALSAGIAAAAAGLRTLDAGPVRLRVVPELEAAARGAGLLEPDALVRAFARPGPAGGRAPTALLDLAGETLLLRRLYHGGVLAPLLGDRFLGDGRPHRELLVTAALRAAGAPVPRPALTLSCQVVGPLRRCALGTFYEANTRDALDFLQARPGPERLLRAAAAAGDAVGRFHAAGGSHADLQLKNLLLREGTDAAECVVIDLDRARLLARLEPRQRMAELMRLLRSLGKRGVLQQFGPRGLARFFSAYCAGDRALRRELRARLPAELRRLARHRLTYRWPAAEDPTRAGSER